MQSNVVCMYTISLSDDRSLCWALIDKIASATINPACVCVPRDLICAKPNETKRNYYNIVQPIKPTV